MLVRYVTRIVELVDSANTVKIRLKFQFFIISRTLRPSKKENN